MRRLPLTMLVAALAPICVSLPGGLAAGPDGAHTRGDARPNLADHALRMLQEGNERFVAGRSTHPNTDVFRVADTGSNGQHPFASIITCADSRVAVERLFDRGVGDLFVVRNAGNICDANQAGSVEYACEHLGTQLVLVLGHTRCGAVKAAIAGGDAGANIGSLLDNIAPAVQTIKSSHPSLAGDDLLDACIRENVWRTIADLYGTSQTVREMVSKGTVKVFGAIYDVSTGRVEWMGQHPMQGALLRAAESAQPALSAPVAEKPASAGAPPAADKPRAEKPGAEKPGFIKPTPGAARKPDPHGDEKPAPTSHGH